MPPMHTCHMLAPALPLFRHSYGMLVNSAEAVHVCKGKPVLLPYTGLVVPVLLLTAAQTRLCLDTC
jgi:hypothetical protein